MSQGYCCTCALPLRDTKTPYSSSTEKPLSFPRTLPCCSRTICASCQYDNPRFESYCPYWQISSEGADGALPKEGLRLPPGYQEPRTIQSAPHSSDEELPPPYSSVASQIISAEGRISVDNGQEEDTVHHLNPDDSLHSLALLYKVPLPVLRAHNSLYSDHLLSARKSVLIPRSHYAGPSLSQPPDPVEEERKLKLRRWMVSTKCADYDIAGLYLKGSDWDLETAVDAYKSDERWEKEHPMQENRKRKGKESRNKNKTAMGLTGQLR